MTDREKAAEFIGAETVWVFDKGNEKNAVKGLPKVVDFRTKNRFGVLTSDCSEVTWSANSYSLTDPRPKREYKEGDFYAVTFDDGEKVIAHFINGVFKNNDGWFNGETGYKIGKELPPELWESES